MIGLLIGAPRRHSAPTGFCRTRRPHVVRAGTVADLKDRFDEINQLISERQGWVTSVRGAPELRFECLPGSPLPDELREAGYEVSETDEGERILPAGLVERFIVGHDGERKLVTEGSTRLAQVLTHAGIVKVMRHVFELTT
ncbi:hypothetical protein [Bradyrhizobium sp. 162]|uniref:hypothetical protein n=1 Tax=Bradyrhizobium sp. 162 TaxID=2782635 RepID=UPI001FF773EC|nr:hypothetical protein [Bradyrhizobium sp. 162]MCK1632660.1 hypothetical protein [Bradyrhizobium sp. 162]